MFVHSDALRATECTRRRADRSLPAIRIRRRKAWRYSLNPQPRYGSRDDQLLDLRRPFEDRVGHPGPSVLFGVVL